MKRRDESPRDEDLRRLFEDLRDEDQRDVPTYTNHRWVREEPETPRTRRWTFAIAGSLATVATAILASWAVGWPLWTPPELPASPAESVSLARTYVPPPPPAKREQALASRFDSSVAVDASRLTALGYLAEPPSEPTPDIPEPRAVDTADNSEQATLLAEAEYEEALAKRKEFQKVDVVETAESAPIESSVSAVSAEPVAFSDEFVRDLPVEGRFYTNVMTLAPGVQDSDGDGTPNVHGSRSRDYKATLGGVSNQDPLTGILTSDINLDSIEELEVVTSGAGVEFGRAQGGYANIVGGDAGLNTEYYAAIEENPFHSTEDEPLSTFSIDVDTASYSNVRRFLSGGSLPPRDAVRIEELINYFDYDHPTPKGDDPFGVAVEVADCPWNPRNRLASITLAARPVTRGESAGSNLVFLIDVSGSMSDANKLPLVRKSLSMLAEQLDGRDMVSIVVYAGASGLVLEPTAGTDRVAILEALERLEAGGSTAGAAGLKLAYRTARENFIEGGVNRVILATDGDFNVGATSHAELLRIIGKDAKRGIFLTALGFGMGNLKDDRLEQLADRGNGNYAYIDTIAEARKVLVEEIGGTLVTVAKDVKIQVEFNPLEVGAYRLIGYENRLLAHRDFNDDSKDAGEIGAGHTVTVLYEIVPPGSIRSESEVDPLRYRRETEPSDAARGGELFNLRVRFKRPDEDTSVLRTYPVVDEGLALGSTSDDFRFATSVAAFGMRLRQSAPVRDFGWDAIHRLAAGAVSRDEYGHRAGFVDLVGKARELAP